MVDKLVKFNLMYLNRLIVNSDIINIAVIPMFKPL